MDTRRLWAERQHLIEEVRRLADEVLATAEDAMERLTPPAEPWPPPWRRGVPTEEAAGGRRGPPGVQRLTPRKTS